MTQKQKALKTALADDDTRPRWLHLPTREVHIQTSDVDHFDYDRDDDYAGLEGIEVLRPSGKKASFPIDDYADPVSSADFDRRVWKRWKRKDEERREEVEEKRRSARDDEDDEPEAPEQAAQPKPKKKSGAKEAKGTPLDRLNADKEALLRIANHLGANRQRDWDAWGLGQKYMLEVRQYTPRVIKKKGQADVALKPSSTTRLVFAVVAGIEYGALKCERTQAPTVPLDTFAGWSTARRRAGAEIMDWFALWCDGVRECMPKQFAEADGRILFSREIMHCGAPWLTDIEAKNRIWARLVKTGHIVATTGPGRNHGHDMRAKYYAFAENEVTKN